MPKYRIRASLSIPISTIIERETMEEALAVAEDLPDTDFEQMNRGNSEDGWTFDDGPNVDIEEDETEIVGGEKT